jgi:histone deacetylase complex regulatory component SIN3
MALPMSTKFGVEERGHVVVNHALCYVGKIKVGSFFLDTCFTTANLQQNRYATQPEVFEQFLKIMMDFHRESTPVPILYAQITQLFSADRDLVEEFQYFLPKTVVEAQAQAAPRLAAENAKIISKSLG